MGVGHRGGRGAQGKGGGEGEEEEEGEGVKGGGGWGGEGGGVSVREGPGCGEPLFRESLVLPTAQPHALKHP